MVICRWCNKEMMDLEVKTCKGNEVVEYSDEYRFPVTYYNSDGRCGDCNVEVGGSHHPGCDLEECPKCGGQLISCGCCD